MQQRVVVHGPADRGADKKGKAEPAEVGQASRLARLRAPAVLVTTGFQASHAERRCCNDARRKGEEKKNCAQ